MAEEVGEKQKILPNQSEEALSENIDKTTAYTKSFDSKYPNVYELQKDKSYFNEANFQNYNSANEYGTAVRSWLNQYYSWYQFQTMQMTMPYYMMGYLSAQQTSVSQGANSRTSQPLHQNSTSVGGINNRHVGQQLNGNVLNQRATRDFRIAPVWKRVAAELFDFLLLFMMKLAVTIVAVEHMGIIDLDKYDIQIDKLIGQNLDYNLALNLTTELVALEVINRVCITLFETLCLRKGIAGMVGGTTPGKRFMGIRVVSCEDLVIDLGNGLVRITPAGDIGFWNALVRSVIKNFSLAFFFPVCFTALFFQHHRAAYDVISNCIVVEPVQQQRR